MRHLLIIPWGMLALANLTEVRAGDSPHPTAPPAHLSSVFVSELWIVQKNLQPYLFDYILTEGLQCKARPVLRITYNKRDHLYLGSCGSAFGWGMEGVGACLGGDQAWCLGPSIENLTPRGVLGWDGTTASSGDTPSSPRSSTEGGPVCPRCHQWPGF